MRRAFLLPIILLAGCGGSQSPFAELYPVKGVVLRDGQPVQKGMIQFTGASGNASFIVNSEVGADGTFALTTVRTTDSNGERKSGAPAGSFTVTYTPFSDQRNGDINPVALPKPIAVEAKPNELRIDLPKKK